MGPIDDSVPLFVDTNLGTHMALPISPEITAGDLKGKLVQEHLCCFTNMGEIKAHRLMVKRRSHFYLLTDTMPIKIAFKGTSGTWFLQMHASRCQTREHGENVKPPKLIASQKGKATTIEGRPVGVEESHVLEVVSDISSRQQFREETTNDCFNQNDNHHLASDISLKTQEREEEHSMNISEKISVTCIISRYFSDFDEVDSCSHQPNPNLKETIDSTSSASEYSAGQKSSTGVVASDADKVCSITKMDLCGSNFVDTNTDSARPRKAAASTKARKTTSFKFSKQASRCHTFFTPPSNSNKHGVGKRVSQAANSIRMSGKRSFKSVRCQKLSAPELNGLVRNHAFDIDEFDD